MYIVVGLGNPGKKYNISRHNIGFEVADEFARSNNIVMNKTKFKAIIGEGIVSGEKVIVVKPQTFMNLSGESVMSIMNFYNLDIENMIVIYDDIDIEVGKLRIRKKGSAGSHNGMRNIIYLLKQDNFPRVRVGVGKPPAGRDLANFIIGKFSKSEQEILVPIVKDAVSAVETIIKDDVDLSMNRYNIK